MHSAFSLLWKTYVLLLYYMQAAGTALLRLLLNAFLQKPRSRKSATRSIQNCSCPKPGFAWFSEPVKAM